jgi:hypothetical protein
MSGPSYFMAVDTLPNVALNLRSKTNHIGDDSNGDPGDDEAYSMRHRKLLDEREK